MIRKVTTAEYRMLEKIFAAEIDAALSKNSIRGIYQTRSTKTIQALKDKGMIMETTATLCGRFPVIVRGWCLTPLGHLTYCTSCNGTDDIGEKK